MPRVVKRTATMVLIECEHLSAKPSKKQMKQVKKRICRHCGFQRDAAKLNLHLICLHPESIYWEKFLEKVK